MEQAGNDNDIEMSQGYTDNNAVFENCESSDQGSLDQGDSFPTQSGNQEQNPLGGTLETDADKEFSTQMEQDIDLPAELPGMYDAINNEGTGGLH